MGYKRKARILFLAEQAALAGLAVQLGHQLGGAWLECRTIPMAQADAALLAWADLLITLDEASRLNLPDVPATAQHRHCPCPDPANAPACLSAHIQSLLGGMKMLSKNEPPPIS